MMKSLDYAVAYLRDLLGDVPFLATGGTPTSRANYFAGTVLACVVFSAGGVVAGNPTFSLVWGIIGIACFLGWWLFSGRRKAVTEDHRARKARPPKIVERASDGDF